MFTVNFQTMILDDHRPSFPLCQAGELVVGAIWFLGMNVISSHLEIFYVLLIDTMSVGRHCERKR